MQELERRSYFKPAQISQGFQPVGAADITPLLRQNQQRQLNEQKMFAEAAMQDMRAQERMHQVAEALETREAEQLAKFSNTLLQTVGDIEKARIEDVKARASSLFYEDAAAVNEVAAEYDSNKAQLNKIRTAESDASSIAFQQGMPYEIVKRWRDMTGHARDAYGAELVANIGTLYRNYQEEQGSSNNTEIQLGNKKVRVNNPDGIAEFSGVRAYTREEFIKQLGIHNLVPGVQAKAFKEMQAVDAKLDNEYETQWNIRNGPVDRKDSTLQLIDRQIDLGTWFQKVTSTPGENGKGTFAFGKAHDYFIDQLVNLSLTDYDRAEELITEYGNLELNGRKFSKLHDERINGEKGFYAKSAKAIENRFRLEDAAGARELKQDEQQWAKDSVNNPDFTQADWDARADQYLEKAARLGQPVVLPRSVQELWKNFSAGAEEIEAMMRQQEQKKRALALDPEEIAKLPPQVQDKYMKDAKAQDAARLGEIKPLLDSVDTLVNKNPSVVGSKALEGGERSPLIAAEAVKRIKLAVINGKRNDPDADAYTLARDEYLKFEKEFQDGLTNDKSPYFIGSEGKLFPNYFGKINADNALSRQLSSLKKARSMTTRIANEGYAYLEDKLLIADSFSQLAKQRQTYVETGVLPEGAIQLATRYNLDPFKVFNAQTKTTDTVEEIPIIRDVQMKTTEWAANAAKRLNRGQGNQQMLQRLTSDNWPVRPMYSTMVASEPKQSRLIKAFEIKESSGNPQAINKDTGASGLIQVLPQNIPGWTLKYLGVRMTPAEYRANPNAQRMLGERYFAEQVRKHTAPGRSEEEVIRRVAAEHYGGAGAVKHWDNPGYHSRSGPYNPGYEDNMQEYTQAVWNLYSQGI
jgi:hypothetical protein